MATWNFSAPGKSKNSRRAAKTNNTYIIFYDCTGPLSYKYSLEIITTGVFPICFLLLSLQILIEVKKTFEKQPSMVEITVPEVSCVFVVWAIHNLDLINTCNNITGWGLTRFSFCRYLILPTSYLDGPSLCHRRKLTKSVCEKAPKSLFWRPACVPGFEYAPWLPC